MTARTITKDVQRKIKITISTKDKAITQLRKSVQSPEQDGLTPASLGHLYGLAGKAAEAQRIIHELKDRSRREYVHPYAFALVYSGLGQKDKAFSWLQKASEEHSPLLTFLKVEPMLDPARSDPRFQQLTRRMGLPP